MPLRTDTVAAPTDSTALAVAADTMAIDTVVAPPPASFDLPAGFVHFSAINPVIVDSIGGDTVSGRIPHFIPVAEADSLRVEALIDSVDALSAIPEIPSGAKEGIAPVAIAPAYSNSTPLMGLIALTLVVTAVNSTGIARTLKRYRHELWSVRRRPNVFDNDSAVSTPMAVLLALVFIIFGGLVLYNIPGYPPSPDFAGAASAMALLGTYYIFRYVAYRVVGFAFTGKDRARQWVAGFMATQAFAGLLIIVPALLIVFEPLWRLPLVITSLVIYSAANLLFIAKGFRIFYSKIQSLLYFILYLCALEIIPVFAIYRLNEYLWALTA